MPKDCNIFFRYYFSGTQQARSVSGPSHLHIIAVPTASSLCTMSPTWTPSATSHNGSRRSINSLQNMWINSSLAIRLTKLRSALSLQRRERYLMLLYFIVSCLWFHSLLFNVAFLVVLLNATFMSLRNQEFLFWENLI